MANNRLAFALCEANGIEIGENWTPHDAWEALKKEGIVDKNGHIREIRFDDEGNIEKSTKELKEMLLAEAESPKKKPHDDLSDEEYILYFRLLGSLKTKYGADYYEGDDYPILKVNNKIILSSGTFEEPKLEDVIEVRGENEMRRKK